MEAQNKFSGWARVEVMGHVTHIGYVTTEYYGSASFFRVDTPGLPEREFKLEKPMFLDGEQYDIGTVVRRDGTQPVSVLVGAGSIYRILPMSEDEAKLSIDRLTSRPLAIVSGIKRGAARMIESADEDEDESGREFDEERSPF